MNSSESHSRKPDGREQPDMDYRVMLNGDLIEIRGTDNQILAEKGGRIYRQLGGNEESPESAVQLLLTEEELRPRSGIFAISLESERGVLAVEVRNVQNDASRQAEILAAVQTAM